MNDEPDPCAYCSEPLNDADSTYKWFPDQKLMRKVHFDHLKVPKEEKSEDKKPQLFGRGDGPELFIPFSKNDSTPTDKWWERTNTEPEPDDLARLREGCGGEK